MITITNSAKDELLRLQKEKAGESQADVRLRIFVEPGGCSGFEYGMSFDQAKEGDETLTDNGVTFRIDATSLEYLRGSEVDFDDGLGGKGFEIRNPNATSTCGCGRSFN
ncbi:MAG: HesB/IscA family protein [Coraliomargaritaceae bacterium]